MRRIPLIALGCAFVFLSLGALVATRVAAGGSSFVRGACPTMPSPIADLKRARCGRLTVPEDRRNGGKRTISLSVAILPATSRRPKSDPIVWLAGGPGDDAITEIPMAVAGKLNADRDVIFMSQRGTYSARPKLTCASVDRWAAKTLNMPYDAAATGSAYTSATLECRREVTARTSDLGAYNTLESADDLEALRVALQIPKWNLFGISYGTDLALTYMRLHSGGIHSVAIDGVFPPPLAGGAAAWTSSGEGINAVFKACRDQTPCRKRYGDIGATFRRLVLQYEASPKTVSVQVPGHPGKVNVKISGGMLAQWAVSPGTHFAAKVPASARTLSSATVVTIPNVAHVAFGSPSEAANACAYAITASFFNRLNRADTSCIRKVPATKFVINP